jgi:hypothetical protein
MDVREDSQGKELWCLHAPAHAQRSGCCRVLLKYTDGVLRRGVELNRMARHGSVGPVNHKKSDLVSVMSVSSEHGISHTDSHSAGV